MIPASNLFKDVYRQTWEEADPLPRPGEPRRHNIEGLMTPIAGAVAALFARRLRPATTTDCLRSPAYE